MKPVLKWVGGKTQLLPVLMREFPDDVTRYAEPFIGGGALFFHLLETRSEQIEEWYISDINSSLLNIYEVLCNETRTDMLISHLRVVQEMYNDLKMGGREKAFYECRDGFNKAVLDPYSKWRDRGVDRVTHAAQMIFLNKTSFNGLWRVTKDGKYNTPFNFAGIDKETGTCRHFKICDEDNIRAVSEALISLGGRLTIRLADWDSVLKFVQKDRGNHNLVYFDPPYRPINKNSFKAYTKTNFNDYQQEVLAKGCRLLSEMGSRVLVSNSNCPDNFFPKIYEHFNIETISARRNINCKGNDRVGTEIIISNYRTDNG
jgi:DNA adenine methylase